MDRREALRRTAGWCAAAAGGLLGGRARGQAGPELPPLTRQGPAAIVGARPTAAGPVPRLGLLELVVDLTANYDNPFDPEQVDLTASITTPSGRSVIVPGFFQQPYRRMNPKPDETAHLTPDGTPDWRIRYTPTEAGTHRYALALTNGGRRVDGPTGEFAVEAAAHPGFVRVSADNPRAFAYDDGSPFFVVGQNVQNDWPAYAHTRRLAAAGCNAVRAWTFCHWTWLEWSYRPTDWAKAGHFMHSYGGPGHYNQRIAWIADEYLARCGADGLRVMLCLGNSGELSHPDDHGYWGGHPYNAANGGPLDRPSEFWTHAEARRLYRNRLRYLVARYSHSPAIWAWELWNELGAESDAIVAWQAEMAGYLKANDPNRHLVTTSHWGTNAERCPRTWALDAIDFTQTHNYAGPDTLRERTSTMLALSDKPHIVGEGGGPGGRDDDPTGVDFHNCLWAAPLAGAAGTTLPWWWRERIEPRGLFGHYTAFARFAASVPWTAHRWRPLPAGEVTVSAPDSAGLRPVRIVPLGGGWGVRAPRNAFRVEPDGRLPYADDFPSVLYGSQHADWANPPTVTVDYPRGGRFVVRISEVSNAVVAIELDGKEVVRDASFDQPRHYAHRDLVVEVPAGRHTVTLRNVGRDWARIGYLLLTDYRDAAVHPDLDAFALVAGEPQAARGECLLWVRHRLNEWAYRELGIEPAPVTSATVRVPGIAAGAVRVSWWDTTAGTVTATERRASNGVLELALPPIAADIACRIEPAE